MKLRGKAKQKARKQGESARYAIKGAERERERRKRAVLRAQSIILPGRYEL